MKFLESQAGMVTVAFAGLFTSIALAITISALWPNNERLFSLIQNVAIGFQGSLFTILQIQRSALRRAETITAKTETMTAKTDTMTAPPALDPPNSPHS